jgi:PAS domain S-box-containing protein
MAFRRFFMTSAIRLLHLEDNALDAELIQEKLAADGLVCARHWVHDRAGFEAALRDQSFDVILCDYNLPNYDGISALRLARERQPEAPVILISGSLGEEEAVKSLQLGATDYLLKERLERVGPAVRRALHDAAESRQRREAERILREQAELLDGASDAIVMTDPESHVIYWNRGAERLFGWSKEEVLGRELRAIIDPEGLQQLDALRGAAEKLGEAQGDLRLRVKDGSALWMQGRFIFARDGRGQVRARISFFSDATEKKQMQENLQRVQRLENLGMLAAGIAHDFNNILAPMVMAGPLLEAYVKDESGRRILEIVEASAARGAALVGQLLSFARGASGEVQLLQLRHVLKDVANLAEATFPKSIQVDAKFDRDLWPINGNSSQLHQVILNLCVNARDAMPDGGALRISADNRAVDAATATALEGGRMGNFVAVEVQDSGSGIAPDVLKRIWEPFFTTKGAGKGTGLGLATVRGILQNHHGFLTLQTREGQGTTFTVFLPAAAVASAGGDPVSTDMAQFRGQGEMVLVVDDEEPVRELAARILTRFGYRVVAARDGAEAISVFTAHAKEVRLLLTDLQMPLLSGPALVTALLRHDPQLRVVAMSGANSGPPEFIAQLAQPLVHKPFNIKDLLAAVHAAIHPGAGPSPSG